MKGQIFVIAAVLAAMLAGCGGQTAAVEQGADTPTTQEAAPLTEAEQAPEAAGTPSSGAEDADSPSSDAEDAGGQAEQDFTSLELEVSKGTLYIRSGGEFSLTRNDGEPADYRIEDGTLYFDYGHTGNAVLVLPEGGSYETLSLTAGEGHVYAEDPLDLQTLELEAGQGEVKLEDITVAGDSSIRVKHGSAFLSGDLGQSIAASCQEGHLTLELSFDESDCNYEVNLSGGGNIQVGKDSYHGLSASKSVDNGGEHSLSVDCSRGDISVSFGK